MTDETRLRILRTARDLISDRARWTTDCEAIDVDGCDIDPDDPRAVAWCAAGAISKAFSVLHLNHVYRSSFNEELTPYLPSDVPRDADEAPIIRANDSEGHGHPVVLRAFDGAIAVLSALVAAKTPDDDAELEAETLVCA